MPLTATLAETTSTVSWITLANSFTTDIPPRLLTHMRRWHRLGISKQYLPAPRGLERPKRPEWWATRDEPPEQKLAGTREFYAKLVDAAMLYLVGRLDAIIGTTASATIH
jgi:hypothetical protein